MSEYSMQEIGKILVKNGFECVGWKGGHCRFKRGEKTVHVSWHKLDDRWINKLLKQNGIEVNK
ncbi:MAG TPA: type II toxin-antitoxin system HicA family toxin [Candidatus Thermoplasmatota archaeon]|nr:type II toxin-antitoxin system HicA family toxin [Candidatus Thermoplasmatota archaeon]